MTLAVAEALNPNKPKPNESECGGGINGMFSLSEFRHTTTEGTKELLDMCER